MKRLTIILVTFVLSVFLVVPAFGIAIIDFRDGSATGGSVVVTGGQVQGINIPLNAMAVIGTASMNGSYDLSGAAYNPADPIDGSAAVLNFNTATGKITIVGGISAVTLVGASSPAPPVGAPPIGTLLLTGTITGFSIGVNDGFTLTMSGNGLDDKSPLLLSYLGIDPTGFHFNTFEIGAQANGNGITSGYVASSTDVNNQGKVPEPITLVLYGIGFAGAGLYKRMRRP